MTERFTVFDVETPNAWNDRMSSIGVTLVENGRIVSRFATLINPETRFDPFNISLTGIRPEDVRDKPTFSDLWPDLRPLMEFGVLCAHNAPFDLRVLSSCLQDYGIAWERQRPYVCTVRLSRKCFPNLPDHRLDTVSRALGIALEHHIASSDSDACAGILIRCLRFQGAYEACRRVYDLRDQKTLLPKRVSAR